MASTYLTTDALAQRIHYDARTIRDRLKDSVLLEGIHYFRPFGCLFAPKPEPGFALKNEPPEMRYRLA